MTLTVRLPGDLEDNLDRYCAASGKTRSWVVNESLAAYLVEQMPAPHALWQQFRPVSGSRNNPNSGDLALRHSAIMKAKLRAKHPR